MIDLESREIKYSEEDMKRTRVVFLLFAVISAGIFFGTMLFRGSSDTDIFMSDVLSGGFIKLADTQSVLDVFYRSVSGTSLLVIILFLLGFCCISQPAELFILFYRGMTLGIAVSFVYGAYGVRGAAVALFMILPHAVITSTVLVFAAREAMRLSNIYIFYIAGRISETDEKPELRLYAVRFAVLMFFVLISSVIDCVITYFLTDKLLF